MSTRAELTALLEASFEDHRLSRAEKGALKQALERGATDDDRAFLRHVAFEKVRQHTAADGAEALGWLEETLKALLPKAPDAQVAEAVFSPGVSCRQRIQRAFSEARLGVDVCVFTITDNEVTDSILAAHRRGVAVRIITDNDKSEDRGSDIERLQAEGVAVRMDDTEHHMHHKFAVFDERLLLNGSYNWTRSAARHNQENITVTNESSLVRSFLRTFESLWRQFE